MAGGRYAPLSTNADQELDAAFDDGHDEDDVHLADAEREPLTRAAPHTPRASGGYDFEREYEYDRPPPGSPPGPSAFAMPNDYGNSNGQLPSAPVVPVRQPAQRGGPRSLFRRLAGAVLPTHYARVPSEDDNDHEDESGRRTVVGGGTSNDGVFANVTAKPQRQRMVEVRNDDGSMHLVPEETQKEAPPSYADAAQDAAPPYWETTVHAPAGSLDPSADMIIDDLPSGSPWVFFINVFISWFFQYLGFLLTYLLHTSHAAKYGSRAGLGLTLIQFGFFSRSSSSDDSTSADGYGWQSVPVTEAVDPTPTGIPVPQPTQTSDPTDIILAQQLTTRDWLSFLFMTLGWFLLLSSTVGYLRVKRWEASIRATSQPSPATREMIEQDIQLRRNLEAVFGIGSPEEAEPSAGAGYPGQAARAQIPPQGVTREMLEEVRLTRDLRAAGLL